MQKCFLCHNPAIGQIKWFYYHDHSEHSDGKGKYHGVCIAHAKWYLQLGSSTWYSQLRRFEQAVCWTNKNETIEIEKV